MNRTLSSDPVNLELRRLILRKRMRTTNVNVVRGRSYDFIIRKFPADLRSTVYAKLKGVMHVAWADY